MKKNVLEIHDLTVTYDAKPVLWDIELTLPQKELIAIVGPNGAGKTTLLKSIIGLLKPISGTITFLQDGLPIKNMKNKIGYVPQGESIDWDFPTTVFDVVLMGRYGHIGWIKKPGPKDKELTLQILDKVGMMPYKDRQIRQLSGGQQQRVFLARALVQNANIYLLDEPFKGVDIKTEKVIIHLLKELQAQGKTVIVVHHDLPIVANYFSWVTFINQKIIANGPVTEVFTESIINQTYQGSDSSKRMRS